MPGDPKSNGANVPFGYLVAGSEMASFTAIGLLVDYLLGTLPVFTILLTLLGVAAAFWMLIKMSKSQLGKRSEQPPPGGSSP